MGNSSTFVYKVKSNSKIKIEQKISEGRFIVSIDESVPYLNSSGEKRVRKEKRYNVLGKDGFLVSPDWFLFYEINELGDIIIALSKTGLKFELPTSSSRNVSQEYRYLYGLINRFDELSIKPIYDYLEFANESACIATKYDGVTRYGYVDNITGEQITPIIFLEAYPFYCERARVKYLSVTAFIDRNKVMKNPKDGSEYAFMPLAGYTVSDFNDGKARVRFSNHFETVEHYIDKNGRTIENSFRRIRKI